MLTRRNRKTTGTGRKRSKRRKWGNKRKTRGKEQV